MPDDLATYFQRLVPVRFPREPGQDVTFYDVFRAVDRVLKALFVVTPRALDRARKWRNAYITAVKL